MFHSSLKRHPFFLQKTFFLVLFSSQCDIGMSYGGGGNGTLGVLVGFYYGCDISIMMKLPILGGMYG